MSPRHAASLLFLILSFASIGLRPASPSAVSPTPAGQVSTYVFDEVKGLPGPLAQALENKLRSYAEQAPGCIWVALQNELPPGQTIESVALRFFHERNGRPTDVVLLVTLQDHHVTLQMGERWVGLDSRCRDLIKTDFVPALRRNDLAGGLNNTVDRVQDWLLHPSAPTPGLSWFDQLGTDQIVIGFVLSWGFLLVLVRQIVGEKAIFPVLLASGPGCFGAILGASIASISLRKPLVVACEAAMVGFLLAAGLFWLFLMCLSILGRRLFSMGLFANLAYARHGSGASSDSAKSSNTRKSGSVSSSNSYGAVSSDSANSSSSGGGFGSGASSDW